MSKRRIILLVVAGLIALLTVGLTRSMMKPQDVTAAPEVIKTTQILAASRDLSTGTILKDSDLKWIDWSADANTDQLYLKGRDDQSRLSGAVLRDGIRSGEPILVGHVVQPHDHGFLAAVLTPGKRAMSVTLSPNAEVAGFIFPGDNVDVILTHSFSRKDSADLTERHISETVLSDVRVLALDQKSDSFSSDPKIAQLATLEVTPKQAEKLALASEIAGTGGGMAHGSLSLVLRSLGNDDSTPQSTGSDGQPTTAPSQEGTTTWDSDVSPAFPGVNGKDSLIQRVHIMRGKEETDDNFVRQK